ncbi:ABC transporter [Methanocella arvoryzae]|uniref:Uncharacterized protein n=1 Tax=Methanocella arvoryzae (strain DSM 22066 / NBRC 105507 / MRE50) TaxID=351160 RepID=Q0W3H2_METAR|nr:ABC transporter [Methanocella arvoryzae]CAJ37071.1 conserved hypothetical protein [Methanocella arvoryzae MRE50]
MKNILIIATREVKRFSTRFRGNSRALILAIIAASLLISYFVSQGGLTLSKGMYTVGVSADGPAIDDSRFRLVYTDPSTGYNLVRNNSIDAYVSADTVTGRSDSRSRYAIGALKQYLEKQELERITEQYDIDRAYPLRIETHYLNVNTTAQAAGGSITDLIGHIPEPAASEAPVPTPTTSAPVVTVTAIPAPTPTGGGTGSTGSTTDAAVKAQLEQAMNGTQPKFKAQFVSENEIIVPSLMNPPVPLSQVIIAFLYIVPIFFISVFFTSSFMDEKINRKLNILMSTPVSALDVIMGKMLPYLAFALVVIVGVTLALNGNLLLAIAIFTPIVLFIFAVYLMVALFYRTYKDQTFFSMAAITFITGYLVFPALFTGINNLSFISPLTLAVQMYRGESFGLLEYTFSTLPMYLVFLLAMYVGVRIFNEEYLLSYGPLYRKVGDAIYLAINKNHVYLSIALLSLLLIPAVFMVQLIIVALATNIQQMFLMFIVLLVFSALVEEIAKSAGIVMLLENGMLKSYKEIVALSFLSALGFLIGEKALLYLSLGIISGNVLMEAINDAGLLLIPLVAHFIFTTIVCVSTRKLGTKWYIVAVLAGTLVHTTYNIYNLRAAGLF